MPGRIAAHSDFAALRSSRKRGGSGGVRVTFSPTSSGVSVAYAINKKFGGAVVRNRARRRLRHIFYEHQDQMTPGLYLVSLAPDAAELGFAELKRALLRAAGKAVAQ